MFGSMQEEMGLYRPRKVTVVGTDVRPLSPVEVAAFAEVTRGLDVAGGEYMVGDQRSLWQRMRGWRR